MAKEVRSATSKSLLDHFFSCIGCFDKSLLVLVMLHNFTFNACWTCVIFTFKITKNWEWRGKYLGPSWSSQTRLWNSPLLWRRRKISRTPNPLGLVWRLVFRLLRRKRTTNSKIIKQSTSSIILKASLSWEGMETKLMMDQGLRMCFQI